MMKTRFSKYIPLLALLFFNSCSTIIFFNKTIAPEIPLEKDEKTLLVNNYFDYTREKYVKEKHQEVYKAAAMAFSESIKDFVNQKNKIMVIAADTALLPSNKLSPSDLLTEEEILNECNKYAADMLLSIDSVSIDFDWETEVVYDDDGGKSKTKFFYIQTVHFLSLYRYDGQLIDRSLVALEHPYSARPTLSAIITIKPNLRKALDEVLLISSEAGIEYGSRFFETQGLFSYKVYHTGPFQTAYNFMQRNMWADAIRELLPLAESGDRKTVKKAAQNLYVAYEGIGDEVSAASWLTKAK